MSTFLTLVEFLVVAGVIVAGVSNYLIVNNLWKRKAVREVSESVSISAALRHESLALRRWRPGAHAAGRNFLERALLFPRRFALPLAFLLPPPRARWLYRRRRLRVRGCMRGIYYLRRFFRTAPPPARGGQGRRARSFYHEMVHRRRDGSTPERRGGRS